ncbi:MAG: thioesterase family protein [Devosiaceae bacterium]|nr:thioesterase family protein [Devosiaceae bacterium MH13]
MDQHTGQGDALAGLAGLLATLDLKPCEEGVFEGTSPPTPWNRVYGGQIIGQALIAAGKALNDPKRAPHSLHLTFLKGGSSNSTIRYATTALRAGRAFTAIRVDAAQEDRLIATATVSFHKPEATLVSHNGPPRDAVPDPPTPDTPDFLDFAPLPIRRYWQADPPLSLKPVNTTRYEHGTPQAPQQGLWVKASSALPAPYDTPMFHVAVLAYASDMTLLDTAVVPQGETIFSSRYAAASLDHAMWFHRPLRADQWHYYEQDSPVATDARGFSRGAFYQPDGALVASTAQEGVIRAGQR